MKFKQYHARAGYYLVIDGERTGIDYAYMHLRDARARRARATACATGQLIGYVGDTGDASGCHLHFEMWTAPGWYNGGSAVRPAARPAGLGRARPSVLRSRAPARAPSMPR